MIERIKQLLDWQQLSPTQFADRIGVGRPVVSHILSERNKPSLEVARSIKAAFPELSLDWLVNGSGAMLVAPAPAAAVTPAAMPSAAPIAPSAASPLATQRKSPGATVASESEPRVAILPDSPPVSAPRAAVSTAASMARFRAEATPAAPAAAAARFVVGSAKPAPAKPLVEEQPALTAAAQDVLVAPELSAAQGLPPEPAAAEAGVAAAAPTALPSTPVESAVLAQVLGDSLGTPGKTIRRIVLFYTDGSFADYKPE